MPNLKRRIELLEGLRHNVKLDGLTDEESTALVDELVARISASGVKVDTPEEWETYIAKLESELAEELEQDHAKH